MKQQNFHEVLSDETDVIGPSNRSFGVTVGIILGCIGVFRCYIHGVNTIALAIVFVGVSLLCGAILFPQILTVANMAWMKIGNILFKFINPTLMFVLYYICFAPIGLMLKLFRYDPLKSRFETERATYWNLKPKSEIENPMQYQF
jgi:hypothetical protein